MIQALIHGRLGGDPTERRTLNINNMATASVGVKAVRSSQSDDTAWLNVVTFGKAAEALLRHHKGNLIAEMGPTHRSRFTGAALQVGKRQNMNAGH